MPDYSGDIVVFANPEDTTTGSYASVATTSGPPGGGANAQLQVNNSAAANSVTIDSDVTDEDIVVIAQRLKSNNQNINMQLTPVRTIVLPCIGAKSTSDIRKLALSLRFQVRTKNYGAGRAGENRGASNQPITVEINKDALRGYDLLTGGLSYLSLHEIAHSFKEMRDFNKAQFEAYSNRTGEGGGAGMSLADRRASFPMSSEFAVNEARANAIARAIANSMNGMNWTFDPEHGYDACP